MLHVKLNIQRFAGSVIALSSPTSNAEAKIEWSSTSNGSTANSSEVTASVYLRRTKTGNTSGTFSGTLSVGGNYHSISQYRTNWNVSWQLVGTYNCTIPHNNDGTKQIWIGATFSNSGTSLAGTYDGGQTVALDSIQRASLFSTDNDITLDSNYDIEVYRKSENFTHTFIMSVWSTGVEIERFENVGANLSWKPTSVKYAPYCTNNTSFTISIKCITYNGDDEIGYTYFPYTIIIPDSVKPTVSMLIAEANETMKDLNWGVYVQGKSKLAITVTGTPIYSSPIKSYSTLVNEVNYALSSFTTNVLSKSGIITATVTDERNRTSVPIGLDYEVVPYSKPSISEVNVTRCTSDGTTSDNGTYVKYTFVGNISSVNNKNSKTFKIGYKLKNATNYTYKIISTSAYSLDSKNVVLNGVTFSANSSYDFIFEVIDSFEKSYATKEISTGLKLMNFNNNGKAMAIGKVSEAGINEELLEIALPTKYKNKPLLEYEIVDTW